MRPLILACACALGSCSTDVFETDGGTDAGVDVVSDASVSDGQVFDGNMSDGAACPYTSGVPPACGSTGKCTMADTCCVPQGGGTAQCAPASTTCNGASLQCLGPTECSLIALDSGSPVCCLKAVDGGGGPTGSCPHRADPQASSVCELGVACLVSNGDHPICTADSDCPGGAPNCVFAEIGNTTFTFGICSP